MFRVSAPSAASRSWTGQVQQQTSIWLGLPAADPSNPDWTRMKVTDYLLGGAFGSRITANIREDKGYTYSPGSFFITERKSAVWVEAADVTTGVTGPSLTEIFKEIDRVRHELPPDAELRGIETSLAGDFIIRNSSRFGVIRQLQFVDQHGLDAEYLSSYVKNLMAVTPEDVRATAQKYLAPERLSIAIVGDKKTVEPQLTKLKLVPSS